jgi:hypothetical protein
LKKGRNRGIENVLVTGVSRSSGFLMLLGREFFNSHTII